MKIAAAAVAALLATSSLAADAEKPAQAAQAAAAEKTAVIPVKGMHCGGCVSHVTEAVQKLEGVKSVHTDLDKAQTTVVFDPSRVKAKQIVAAIAETGYKPGKPRVK